MNDNEGIKILICLSLMAVSGITYLGVQKRAERHAIEHQAAHYDARTGDFTWNLPEQK